MNNVSIECLHSAPLAYVCVLMMQLILHMHTSTTAEHHSLNSRLSSRAAFNDCAPAQLAYALKQALDTHAHLCAAPELDS